MPKGSVVVGCWLSVVGCRLSVVGCRLSVVGCRLSVVGGNTEGPRQSRGPIPFPATSNQQPTTSNQQPATLRGKPIVVLLYPLALARVGEAAVCGDHVVHQELDPFRPWNHARHRGMRGEILEEELSPGRHREVARP